MGASATENIQTNLAAICAAGTRALESASKRAKKEGDLPGLWEPASLAQYLTALVSGLAVQSASGVSRVALNKVIDQIMANWPEARVQLRTDTALSVLGTCSHREER